MNTWITICDTCKRDDWETSGAEITDGEELAALVEFAAMGNPSINVRRVSCLMGCSQSCNVAIQSEGKLCYTLGRLEPDTATAAGLVEWAGLHASSASGQVPYKTWPEAVKGHFITRHPPLPKAE